MWCIYTDLDLLYFLAPLYGASLSMKDAISILARSLVTNEISNNKNWLNENIVKRFTNNKRTFCAPQWHISVQETIHPEILGKIYCKLGTHPTVRLSRYHIPERIPYNLCANGFNNTLSSTARWYTAFWDGCSIFLFPTTRNWSCDISSGKLWLYLSCMLLFRRCYFWNSSPNVDENWKDPSVNGTS